MPLTGTYHNRAREKSMPGAPLLKKPTSEDLDLLSEISQMLTLIDREQLLERVIELTAKAFGAERASLMLNPEIPEDWEQALIKYRRGAGGIERVEQSQSVRFAKRVMRDGLAGWVVRERSGVVITDTREDARWVTFDDSTSSARSVLCVPFQTSEAVIGVLTLLHSDPEHFDASDLQTLTIIANQTTVALHNATLFSRMRHKERQLEAILSAMPDSLIVLDQNGRVLKANHIAAAWLDMTADALVGMSIDELSRRENLLELVRDIGQNPLQAGQSWSFETHSEKRRSDYLLNISVWQSSVDGSGGYVVVIRDITTLRDLNRFKDEMLHIASHDLRSPLALIIGYCSLIEFEVPEDSPVKEYLGAIEKATHRMQGLLDDLLRVEKIRTSPMEMVELVYFADLVTSALNQMRPQFDSKHQHIEVHVDVDSGFALHVNSSMIREAIENYLENASKYTPDGGRIDVYSSLEGNRVNFVVEDTGIGIPPSALPRVFEAFYRVPRSDSDDVASGRGLGLHLVKAVIERHKGEVWLESESGAGSRFGFWLPAN